MHCAAPSKRRQLRRRSRAIRESLPGLATALSGDMAAINDISISNNLSLAPALAIGTEGLQVSQLLAD